MAKRSLDYWKSKEGSTIKYMLLISYQGHKKWKTGSSAQYLCRCVCGKEKITDYRNLKWGSTFGCGCKQWIRTKSDEYLGISTLFTSYKNGANTRKIYENRIDKYGKEKLKEEIQAAIRM